MACFRNRNALGQKGRAQLRLQYLSYPTHLKMTMKRLLWLTLAGAVFIASAPQSVQALSVDCCTSLDEMEQHSDLIIRGRALQDIEDTEEFHFSEAEYQAHLATGKVLPLGASAVVHDDKWQIIMRYTTLPVKVLTVLEGETTAQIIGVAQENDWGATPMVKNAEYLLFLNRSLNFDTASPIYYDFYSQGKYNLDGTDPAASSPEYYNLDEVKQRYGDRVTFVSTPPNEAIDLPLQAEKETARTHWLKELVGCFRHWLAIAFNT
jgi:hypothetical protein